MGKYVFRWEKLNFEHIGNSVHTTEFLALGKIVNIYINYLIFLPRQKTCGMKALQVYKFTFKNDFMLTISCFKLLKILSLSAEPYICNEDVLPIY